jgi:hypothetical protein
MNTEVSWTTQPAAANLVQELVSEFLNSNGFARTLRDRLLHETGTRFLDWIECLRLPATSELQARLHEVGYQLSQDGTTAIHNAGLFPRIELTGGTTQQLVLKVESVVDFVFAHRLMERAKIEGSPEDAVRQVCVATEGTHELWVRENHGGSRVLLSNLARHDESFRLRERDFPSDAAGFEHTRRLIRQSIAEIGIDRTCDLFFRAEREYWQLRNRAARVQRSRQDALGMGWANHDHHTYRSSRDSFAPMIAIFEEMGFDCRERFYAGRAAGWGAQVLEQPTLGIVIFADVDLSPEEVTGDFAHESLPPRRELGTVGLWCALHGEAFFQAGMHHLECQFDFTQARDQLKPLGIESMKPFTDFAFLRQSFTKGEIWKVAEPRIAKLLAEGRITVEQAAKFRLDGALGSHLEILQRDDGYKGFNQTGINEIILKTDPRQFQHSH